jgi:hypothetical protein
MRRIVLLLLAGALCALSLSFLAHRHDALANLSFRLGVDRELKEEQVVEAVRLYNRVSAAFYGTAGDTAGLDFIPAAPFLKRRLFKDISTLKADGLLMVFDLDSHRVVTVRFHRPDMAEAVTEEVWAMALQDVETREPASTVKARKVRARYVLHHGALRPGDERWFVTDMDVYPSGADIPPVVPEPAL